MSNLYTVECRQLDSGEVFNNGDFTTNLQEQVVIENGDTIVVKQSYIDTEATSSGKIIIPNDLTLSLEYYLYMTYSTSAGYEVVPGYSSTIDPPISTPYVACNEKTSAGFTMAPAIEFRPLELGYLGGLNVTLEWTDIYGAKATVTKLAPRTWGVSIIDHLFVYKTVDGIKIISPDPSVIAAHNMKVPGIPVYPIVMTENIFTPITFTTLIDLPAGNYDPSQLITHINRELQFNKSTLSNVIGSKFLTAATSPGSDAFAFQSTKFLSLSSGLKYNATPNPNYIVGATQVNLDYDPAQKVFAFKYAHTPVYSSGQEIVKYSKVGTDIRVETKASGIIFKRLSAYIKGSPTNLFDFWSNILGFNVDPTDPTSMIPTLSMKVDSVITPACIKPNFTPDIEDGLNVTGAYQGIADMININNDPANVLNTLPILATSTITTPINAHTSTLSNVDRFGYYIIEIDSKFKNQYLTPDNNFRNIQSVVSRYYSINSYTSGTSEGSIVYTHQGSPVMLESFKIRILDSTKELATNIGTDNTVFLEIIKAPKELTKN